MVYDVLLSSFVPDHSELDVSDFCLALFRKASGDPAPFSAKHLVMVCLRFLLHVAKHSVFPCESAAFVLLPLASVRILACTGVTVSLDF